MPTPEINYVAPITIYPDYYRGDTWEGLEHSVTVNGVDPPPSPMASARMHFRRDNKLVLSLSTSDGSIEIVDAATWHVVIPPRILPFTFIGQVSFDLEYTAENGLRRTPSRWVMEIIPDSTRD
jgi:hypothetical protein